MELTPWYRHKNVWFIAGLIIMLIALGLLALFYPHRSTPPTVTTTIQATACGNKSNCRMLIQYSWSLDLKAKTLKRLTKKNQTQPFYLSESGLENSLLSVYDQNNHLVYSRKIFLNTFSYYDYASANGNLHGGGEQVESTVLTSYIPDDLTAQSILKVTSLNNNSLIAQGAI